MKQISSQTVLGTQQGPHSNVLTVKTSRLGIAYLDVFGGLFSVHFVFSFWVFFEDNESTRCKCIVPFIFNEMNLFGSMVISVAFSFNSLSFLLFTLIAFMPHTSYVFT